MKAELNMKLKSKKFVKQKSNQSQSPKMSCLKYGELTWQLCLEVNGDVHVHERGPTSNRTSGTITATCSRR